MFYNYIDAIEGLHIYFYKNKQSLTILLYTGIRQNAKQ